MSTTLPPAPPTDDPGPDPVTGIDPFPGLANAQNNQRISSQNMADRLNQNIKDVFMAAFNSWATNVNAGRIPNTDPPQPPVQWIVSGPDRNGFQWPILDPSGTPVCDMPPLPPDRFTVIPKAPNTIDVGVAVVGGGGSWFTVGDKDSFPVGKTTPPGTTSADGVVGIFQRVGTAVGPGWYELLSSQTNGTASTKRK